MFLSHFFVLLILHSRFYFLYFVWTRNLQLSPVVMVFSDVDFQARVRSRTLNVNYFRFARRKALVNQIGNTSG